MTRLRHDGKDSETGQDSWTLHFVQIEANILSSLPEQLATLLANPNSNRPVVNRLFPASYQDPEEEALNRQLLGDSLLEQRQDMITDVRAQLDAAVHTEEGIEMVLDRGGMDLWLRFMNDVRLILATDLDVNQNQSDTETVDPTSPDAPKHALLEYLGGVEAMMIEALSLAAG